MKSITDVEPWVGWTERAAVGASATNADITTQGVQGGVAAALEELRPGGTQNLRQYTNHLGCGVTKRRAPVLSKSGKVHPTSQQQTRAFRGVRSNTNVTSCNIKVRRRFPNDYISGFPLCVISCQDNITSKGVNRLLGNLRRQVQRRLRKRNPLRTIGI